MLPSAITAADVNPGAGLFTKVLMDESTPLKSIKND